MRFLALWSNDRFHESLVHKDVFVAKDFSDAERKFRKFIRKNPRIRSRYCILLQLTAFPTPLGKPCST